jgi:hypothetical protein
VVVVARSALPQQGLVAVVFMAVAHVPNLLLGRSMVLLVLFTVVAQVAQKLLAQVRLLLAHQVQLAL